MLLLVTTDHGHVVSLGAANLGRLVQPRSYERIRDSAAAGVPWAADNDAFQGWTPEADRRWRTMLAAIDGLPGCRFVTVPDVVGDHAATRSAFEEYAPAVHDVGQPAAFVLQDGATTDEVPWDAVEAVFVGGSTEFKLGEHASALVHDAKARGKWAHMGRVNSSRRVRYAASIGCDSVDGTGYVKWRRQNLPRGIEWAGLPVQARLLP